MWPNTFGDFCTIHLTLSASWNDFNTKKFLRSLTEKTPSYLCLINAAHIYRVIDSICVDRIMTPPKGPRLNPQKFWLCSVLWQGKINVADEIKVVNQLTLKWGNYPWIPSGPIIIKRVIITERGKQNRVKERFEDATLLALKTEDGLDMGSASRIWKMKEMNFWVSKSNTDL